MKSKTSVLYTVLLVLAVIILVNILSERFFFRIDITQDHRYTLSKATKDILKNLDKPVTITAYLSKKLDPAYDNLRRDFEDMLIEYHNLSGGMVMYEIKNPLKDEKTEQEAQQAGIDQLQIQVREKDQFKAQKAYLGAVVKMGDESETIPVVGQTEGMEYNLSTAIKKLSVKDKPRVGILQGNGEPTLQQMQQLEKSLSILYQVEPVNLKDSTVKLDDYKSLAIIAPKDTFTAGELDKLTRFLSKGKGILVAINRVGADQNYQYGMQINTGLEKWLSGFGVIVQDDYLVDAQCPVVFLNNSYPVQFFYFPYITKFANHPVVKGLEKLFLQFASTIDYRGDSTNQYTPLAKSSDMSNTKSSYSIYDVTRNWTKDELSLSGFTVAAALKGKLAGNAVSKMVIIGDGDLAIDSQQNNNGPDNINILSNSVDWLSDDTGLIELRTKGITDRPLKELSDKRRATIKYVNFLLPILLIIGYGLIHMQIRKKISEKRKETGYV